MCCKMLKMSRSKIGTSRNPPFGGGELGAGRYLAEHVRTASLVRGVVSVGLEHDDRRHRHSLVARVRGSANVEDILPLYDVQLLANDGGCWMLVGYEPSWVGTWTATRSLVRHVR